MTFIIVEPAAGARLLSTFSTNTPLCSSKGAVAAGQRPTGYSTSSIHQACADAAGAAGRQRHDGVRARSGGGGAPVPYLGAWRGPDVHVISLRPGYRADLHRDRAA